MQILHSAEENLELDKMQLFVLKFELKSKPKQYGP